MKKSANDCQEIDTETVKENIRQFMKNEALTVADLKELLGFVLHRLFINGVLEEGFQA